MFRLALCQPVKHIVNGILVVFIILSNFHTVQHIHKGVEVTLLLRGLKDDIPDQSAIQKGFRFRPKFIALFAVPFGVSNQGTHKFQNVVFRPNIRQRVIVHGLGKIHAVEQLDFISLPDQKRPHLAQNTALGIDHYIRAMGLQQLGGQPETAFSAAARTDNTAVEIAGVGWIFGPSVHR